MAQLLGAGAKGGGLGWWWHTTEDTLDKIDIDNLVRDARVYAETLWRLCTLPRLPFDYAATADELAQTLQRYHAAANGQIDLERHPGAGPGAGAGAARGRARWPRRGARQRRTAGAGASPDPGQLHALRAVRARPGVGHVAPAGSGRCRHAGAARSGRGRCPASCAPGSNASATGSSMRCGRRFVSYKT